MSEESPPYGNPDRSSAADLQRFADSVRAECDAALARLDTVDRDALSSELREHYDTVRRNWENLRALVDADALALHEAACLQAGRELSPAEAAALLVRQ